MLELPPNYPPLLCELADCFYRRLSVSLPCERAGSLALAVTDALQRQFAGNLIYIPTQEKFERERRNAAIARDFNGTNQRELAMRYGLSLQTVYDILAKQQKKKSEE